VKSLLRSSGEEGDLQKNNTKLYHTLNNQQATLECTGESETEGSDWSEVTSGHSEPLVPSQIFTRVNHLVHAKYTCAGDRWQATYNPNTWVAGLPLSAGIKIIDLQKALTHINCHYRFKKWLIGPFLVVLLHLASHNFPKMAFLSHYFSKWTQLKSWNQNSKSWKILTKYKFYFWILELINWMIFGCFISLSKPQVFKNGLLVPFILKWTPSKCWNQNSR